MTNTFPSNHNGGPPLDDDPATTVFAKIDDLYDEAKNFADGEPIATKEMHDAISELFDSLHEAGKEAEALRVVEKAPLDAAVDACQAKFNPYVQAKKGKVSRGKDALGALLAAWRAEQQRIAADRAARAAKEAADLKAAADKAMQESRGNLAARETAEEQLAMAKDADKHARRTEKAATTGVGLRTSYVAVLTDIEAALDWAFSRDGAAFEALATDLAQAAVRSGLHAIPGFRVDERKTAI